jgi:hypothetical protein
MIKFIVNTTILTPKMDPESCAMNAPNMLLNEDKRHKNHLMLLLYD